MDIITEIIFRIIAFMAELVYTALRFLGFRIAILGTGFFLLHMFSYQPIFIAMFVAVVCVLYAPFMYKLVKKSNGN
ncbi:hypothetical protein [Morganella morganii]|uniref:hypothetical protein n=1 Tax=Morganella morganii TaxID=582 RepID=UPI002368E076|nr:hypothetical protein [Morganella morganii]